MTSPKPIKRNAALVQLSKDHHFALLLVWKIREGIKNSIDAERIRKYAVHFSEVDLLPHFNDEEELLLVVLNADDKMRLRTEKEHAQLREMMTGLKSPATGNNSLLLFAMALESHIRFEERELFNYLQEHLSEKELTEIATALTERQHPASTLWTDAFWIKKVSTGTIES
jgi:hypothetical protein